MMLIKTRTYRERRRERERRKEGERERMNSLTSYDQKMLKLILIILGGQKSSLGLFLFAYLLHVF